MDVILVSLILSFVIAGIVYFSVESLERILEINIMRYIIILLAFFLITFYAAMYILGYHNYSEIIDNVFILGVDLFLIIFCFIEKFYGKFKK